MKKNILELKDVSMVYGTVHALRDINLAVREGEWLAIMGPSGSGKTTMMNIIGCMDKPSFGTVVLDGQDLTVTSSRDLTEIRRDKIGLIFQQFHLISYLTALENVMMAQYYHSMVDDLPNQLSGGEQQRVCIARALINYPKLILADEPTGNLDGENEEIVMDIFRQLHEEGSSIVMVTHSLEVAAHVERHIVLEHGHIVKYSESREARVAAAEFEITE